MSRTGPRGATERMRLRAKQPSDRRLWEHYGVSGVFADSHTEFDAVERTALFLVLGQPALALATVVGGVS